jgi:hypothetical protein
MEGFFHTLKTELVHHKIYATSEAGERQPPAHLQTQRRVLRHLFLQLQRNPGGVFAADD